MKLEPSDEDRARAAAILPNSLQQTELAQAIADAEQRGYVTGLKFSRLWINQELEKAIKAAEEYPS